MVVFGDMLCRQGSLSSRLMAFLCSVMRDLIVFDVSPMYILFHNLGMVSGIMRFVCPYCSVGLYVC